MHTNTKNYELSLRAFNTASLKLQLLSRLHSVFLPEVLYYF